MDLVRGKRRLLTVLALLTWMGVILFLSSRSSLPGDSPSVRWLGQYQDEVGHLVEYAILGLLTYVSLRSFKPERQAVFWGLVLCVVFSLGDEAFQGLIPNRTPELKDIVFDGVGAISALTAAALLEPRLRRYFLGPGTSSDGEATPDRPTLGSSRK